MKYLLLVTVLSALGIAGGWLRTQLEFAGHNELFEVYYDPEGKSTGPTKGSKPDAIPVVSVEGGEEFKFGSMGRYDTFSHDFVIRNEGTAPLELRMQNTTCKCTLAEIDSDTVAPGEETIISLEWKPDSYAIEFAQVARIKTSDPEKPVLELRVTGRVIQPLWTNPKELMLTKVNSREGFTSNVKLFAIEEQFEVLDFIFQNEESAQYFDAKFEPIAADDPVLGEEKAGSGYNVTITAKPGLPLEPVFQELEIKSNIPDTDGFALTIRASVEGEIAISQPLEEKYERRSNTLDLGFINRGRTKEVTFSLFVRGEYSGKVNMKIADEGVTPATSLEAELGETRQNGKVQIVPLKIRVPADAEPVDRLGPGLEQLGRVIVETDHPTDKRIVIYVRFAIDG